MRCLVVDGSAVTRRIVRNVLAGLGADEVVECADPREALESDGPFDLLVAARTLPGMDGIELARGMREKPRGDALPVLVIAAHGTLEDVKLAREAGVAAYVVKPLAAESLRARLESLLPGHATSLVGERPGIPGEMVTEDTGDQARAA